MKNRRTITKVRSGGIILAVKDTVLKHVKIINTSCKYVLWFRLSKSFVNTDEDVIFGIVYLPPEGSRYASSDCFLDIESELISISNDNKYVCLMGDFNSRVGHLHDWFSADEFQAR